MPQIALDTLLAEGVMRWRRIHRTPDGSTSETPDGTFWDPLAQRPRIILNSTAHRRQRWHYPEFPGEAGDGTVWSPSTNAADLQELVQALLSSGLGVTVSLFPPDLGRSEPAARSVHGSGPTLSEAIIAAALHTLKPQTIS